MKNISTVAKPREALSRKRVRGVAAVEFALFLIPMLLLALGVAEYGRALYQYNTIVKSVRDSARLLSTRSPTDADYPAAEARCLAVYGNTGCTGTPLAPGLTTSMVKICNPLDSSACTGNSYANVPTGHGTINLVEVRISGYKFNFVFNPMSFFGNNATDLAFGDIHATMRQVL